MSPPGGRRCPPALLALLLGLARGRGLPECRDGAAPMAALAEGSPCLVPDKPRWEWTQIHWKARLDSGTHQRILTGPRDGSVQYSNSSFRGRAKFHWENFSLCISRVGKADSGVYWVEIGNSSVVFPQCFRLSVWDLVPEPEVKSQMVDRAQGWCRLSLLCSSPGNVSYSWACPREIPEQIPEQIPERIPEQIPEQIPGIPAQLNWTIPEGAAPQICLCNVSNPAGWSAASTELTCDPAERSPGSLGRVVAVAVAEAVALCSVFLFFHCQGRQEAQLSSSGG